MLVDQVESNLLFPPSTVDVQPVMTEKLSSLVEELSLDQAVELGISEHPRAITPL